MKKFERWCARHEKFGIRNLMLYIIIGNVSVFILQSTMNGAAFVYNWLQFDPSKILSGQIWRLVSFVFIPVSGDIFSLVLSSFFYYFVGQMLENEWGRTKLTVYYLAGVIMHIITGFVLYAALGGQIVFLNTHYLNMSLFLAYATIEPNAMLRMFLLIPVKVKWLAVIDAVYIAAGLFLNPFPFNMVPVAVLLNYILFFAPRLVKHAKRRKFETSNRIDFQKKSKEIKKRGYLHRCVVCGKTDISHPDAEFRYCSLCNNYACYCDEHIMDHTHIN